MPRPLDMAAAIDQEWRATLHQAYLPEDGEPSFSTDRFWEDAVRTYTSCNLSQHDDKLTAMWGVAKTLGDVTGERYGVGFWEGRGKLVDQLGWEVTRLMEYESHLKKTMREYACREGDSGLKFPTWSWASIKDGTVEGAGNRGFSGHNHNFYVAKNHDGGDLALRFAASSFLEVNSGEPQMMTTILDIQGLFGACKLRSPASRHGKYAVDVQVPNQDSGVERAADGDHIFAFLDTSDAVKGADVNESYDFILLAANHRAEPAYNDRGHIFRISMQYPMVYDGFGLVLKKRIERQKGQYQRVGLLKFEGLESQGWEALCEACELKLDKNEEIKSEHVSWSNGTKIHLW